MKFLSITGPKWDFDRVTNTYLSKYETQLENALSELKTVDNLTPFTDHNPYKDALAKAEEFCAHIDESKIKPDSVERTDQELFQLIRDTNHDFTEIRMRENRLKAEKEKLVEKLQIIQPFRAFQFDLHSVLQYKYVKFRFGRVLLDYYHKLEKYIYEDLNIIFLEGGRDANYVYGVYFVSKRESERQDAIFKSMHFERLFLPDEYDGNPYEAAIRLENDIQKIEEELNSMDSIIAEMLEKKSPQILSARDALHERNANFELRKVAACVEDKNDNFYILCGWMAEKDVEDFLEDVKDDPNVFVVVEDDKNKYFGEPPSKLKNPGIFKPFEMLTKMYGMPAHNEMDPTIFIALTYTFIFGVMFGDLGQGAMLFIGGALIYKFKKNNLAAIISIAGIFSMFFGLMFGSVFGFENLIPAFWLHPTAAMTELPFVGNLNTILVVAVAFGMILMLVSMIFNIINAIKAHDLKEVLFEPSGVAGFVFYLSLVVTIVLYMTENPLPATIVLVIMFVIPLILMFFKEPLVKKLQKKTYKTDSLGLFIVEGFFELFEVLLTYFSNTLSFIRIGAFAIIHAAMMQVVLMLAGAEVAGGEINWVVVVLGNLFVSGLEGLIVGIQVLRLEYYELFSRYYKGTGREFKPYIQKEKK